MALSRVVSEIFNVEKYRVLEIPVKGQSRSLKVVPVDRQGMVSYLPICCCARIWAIGIALLLLLLVLYGNFVPKMHHF